MGCHSLTWVAALALMLNLNIFPAIFAQSCGWSHYISFLHKKAAVMVTKIFHPALKSNNNFALKKLSNIGFYASSKTSTLVDIFSGVENWL